MDFATRIDMLRAICNGLCICYIVNKALSSECGERTTWSMGGGAGRSSRQAFAVIQIHFLFISEYCIFFHEPNGRQQPTSKCVSLFQKMSAGQVEVIVYTISFVTKILRISTVLVWYCKFHFTFRYIKFVNNTTLPDPLVHIHLDMYLPPGLPPMDWRIIFYYMTTTTTPIYPFY